MRSLTFCICHCRYYLLIGLPDPRLSLHPPKRTNHVLLLHFYLSLSHIHSLIHYFYLLFFLYRKSTVASSSSQSRVDASAVAPSVRSKLNRRMPHTDANAAQVSDDVVDDAAVSDGVQPVTAVTTVAALTAVSSVNVVASRRAKSAQ